MTFGDVCEHHIGMEMIGRLCESGLSLDELKHAQKWFEKRGVECELVHLNDLLEDVDLKGVEVEDAYILIARKGVEAMLGVGKTRKLMKEQKELEWDKKMFAYGRVMQKKARWNLCYSDFARDPDYEHKMGRMVDFKSLKYLRRIRKMWKRVIGSKKVKRLQCEGNRYYDVNKCFIGFHSDLERKIVIAIRLGAEFGLYYNWYYKGEPTGRMFKAVLGDGDIYLMSAKSVGFDGRKRTSYTLRHCALNDEKLIEKALRAKKAMKERKLKQRAEKRSLAHK